MVDRAVLVAEILILKQILRLLLRYAADPKVQPSSQRYWETRRYALAFLAGKPRKPPAGPGWPMTHPQSPRGSAPVAPSRGDGEG